MRRETFGFFCLIKENYMKNSIILIVYIISIGFTQKAVENKAYNSSPKNNSGAESYSIEFGRSLNNSPLLRPTRDGSMAEYVYFTDDEKAGGAPFVFNSPGERRAVIFGGYDVFSYGNVQSNSFLVMSDFGCPTFLSTVFVTIDPETGEPLYPMMGNCQEGQVFQGDPPLLEVPPVIFPPDGYAIVKDSADYIYDSTELFKYNSSFHRDTLIMTDIEFLPNSSFQVKRWWFLKPPHLNEDANLGGAELPNPTSPYLDGVSISNWDSLCTSMSDLRTCTPYIEAMADYHAKYVVNGNDMYMNPTVNGPHGFAHYDYPQISDNLLSDEIEFVNEPKVIYVQGGPVRVHGIYSGQYTIVTDEYQPYHRHAWPQNNASPIDTLWCNIWITDNLRNADAAIGNQSPPQPDEQCEGGSNNRMGLISGANVIIANTFANGAHNSSNGSDVIIHAAIMALNESFTVQYWQNTTFAYWDNPPPKGDGLSLGIFGSLTAADNRGTIYLSGGIVQKYRGYVIRNSPGPYEVDVGYAKNYNFDGNNACSPPPFFPETNFVDIAGCTDAQASNYEPDAIIDDGSCIYGMLGDLNQDNQLNVLDIVITVNIIMEDIIPDEFQLWAADSNEDDSINVLDIVGVVQCIITFCWDNGEDTCIDIDGNVYNTIIIGNQEWMAENLKVTHYRNGDEIPTGYSDEEWSQLDDTETGVFAIYDDDPANEDTYGNLYNWYAVDDTRDICPDGWHVPMDTEWTELTDYLGGTSVAGGKMKSTGYIEGDNGLWYFPNIGATNESGFTALPGGYRYGYDGLYYSIGGSGHFWSSTAYDSYSAWRRSLYYYYSSGHRYYYDKQFGLSVRCLKDAD